MLKGQIVDGLSLLSWTRPIEMDRARQRRNCVLNLSSPIVSPTTVFDVSGKGNHGTLTGAIWVREPSGVSALDYDGTDDFTEGPGAVSLGLGSYMIKVWVISDLAAGAEWEKSFCRNFDVATSTRAFNMFLSDTGTWNVGLFDNVGAATNLTSNISVIIGNPTMICLVHNALTGRFQIFVNGVQANDTTDPANLQTALGTFRFGYGATANRFFDGGISLPLVITRVPTAAEIMEIYNQERHLFAK